MYTVSNLTESPFLYLTSLCIVKYVKNINIRYAILMTFQLNSIFLQDEYVYFTDQHNEITMVIRNGIYNRSRTSRQVTFTII